MAKPTTGKNAASQRQTPASPSAELLLEIGTEELPHQFIAPALRSLRESAERLFKEHRLTHGTIGTFGTPRRLVLVVQALAGRQTATMREAMGPSKAVAFDAAGQPTKAALGFAGSQGIAVAELEIRQTPKGEYVFAVKRDQGRTAPAILADLLPGLIAGLSFPKSMKWNETGLRFARPIRWLLALYGGKPVPFQVGGISSGAKTWGHRFLGPSGKGSRLGLPVKDLKSYQTMLKKHFVIPDQDERRRLIDKQLEDLARSARGHLHRDEELLEQAVYAVEHPHAVLGEFNPQYLSLPKEIIMTAMKEHQGFFALMDRKGNVLPRFISVTNMKLPNMGLIRAGNERVLAARLADAKFYFDEDRKTRLADRVDKLKGVTFHQKIGTQYDRTQRIHRLADELARMLCLADSKVDWALASTCTRAAQLSKADLVTGVVGEFPTLQGVMGGEYARHDGEPEEVCRAIAEQYLPRFAEDELPKTQAGMILSLADRLDSIFSFFRVGLIPSGSEDPFGLRRHALAIVRIILEGKLPLGLGKLAVTVYDILLDAGIKSATAAAKADTPHPEVEFILDRLRYYGRTVDGLRDDVMDAVLEAERKRTPTLEDRFKNLPDLYARMKAIQAITTRPEFDPLMIGFKRAHRIVEKEQWVQEEVDPVLFQHPSETELHKALDEVRLQVPYAIAQGDYATALDGLVRLKPAIDAFFVGVLVNTEEKRLRENRLSLLRAVDRLFLQFADFSQIVVQGA